ncbi:ABC transporter permease [Helicobacter heilmannii]|uniref:Lipoprotein releasing system transmembrane protein LolC n=1 Tax=Helicobacter heilmannii TaxID=35817 RepID=A0A0K2Y765_HELHE|nr:ABC transporter permease [Helicobacter heilmannii]BDQ26613.1 membrane protein [Helicobacter heilmannii]CCM10863.2 Lipoprotein releasing system transmembrane protein LolC [Helicobacter heilmannii ASB1.4]CRI35011.1 Lipoprotein releasing system transmembrane protein LolC [Helicobacter heilmannii]
MPSTSLVAFLVRRYLRFDKTQPFISITAILAFLGVGVGVMVLIVAMAIMNGMNAEFEKKLFVMNYPLTLYATSYYGIEQKTLNALEQCFPHLRFSPYLQSQVVARFNGMLSGGMLFGVDIQKEVQINDILKKGLEGVNLQAFKQTPFNLVAGKGFKESLLLGNTRSVDLFFTKLEPTGFVLSPTMKRFSLKGFFESGLKAYDGSYLYTNIEALQAIRDLPEGVYDGVHIYSKHPMQDMEKIKQALKKIPNNGVDIEGWWQQNGNFFSAMALEKRALFIVLMLIILMASLNIISSLLMVVMNRRKEIALLLSLGATTKEIQKSFFTLGSVIGVGGIVLGVLLAFLVLWVLATFPIISLPADVYGIDKLPLDLSAVDFFSTLIGALVIVALSSHYPARKAASVDALSILRNE